MNFNPIEFVRESYQELLKSTWLTRQQATTSTIVVLVLVVLLAAYAGTIDAALSVVMKSVLGNP